MGMVLEGIDDKLGRHAAIKLLHRQYANDQEMLTRFFNEARAANLIGHPGLAQVYDCDRLPDGSTYLLMEYLEGETLAERLERHKAGLAIPQVLRFGWQIADALTAAHARDIIHRDLKPSNVMLVRDAAVPGGERIKVLDFGIAKLSEPAGKGPTRTGSLMGTLVYISPEQCLSAGRVDGRADVYSLGCMLYELVTGSPPFVADSEPALITMHLHTVPKLLSEVAPQAPEGLSALVARMLIKSRDERPTMKEVAAALSELSPGLAPDAASSHDAADVFATTLPRGQLPRSVRRASGRSLGAAILAGASLLLGLAIGGGFYYGRSLAGQELARAAQAQAAVPAQAQAQAAMVKWQLTSDPADAEVVRDYDQQRLGTTPFQHAQPASRERLLLVLRKAGYRPAPVQIDLAASGTRNVVLEPAPSPPPGPVASQPPTSGTGPVDPRLATQPQLKSGAKPKPKAVRTSKDLPLVE